MRFINRGEPIKIRKDGLQGYHWVTLKTGETIDLPENVGRENNLEELKATEGKAGQKKVETKQLRRKNEK